MRQSAKLSTQWAKPPKWRAAALGRVGGGRGGAGSCGGNGGGAGEASQAFGHAHFSVEVHRPLQS